MTQTTEILEGYRRSGGVGEPRAVTSAPGRVNLLGQHIDHQGGCTNPIAIRPRIRVAVGPLAEPILRCRNADPAYAPFEARLDFLAEAAKAESWKAYLRSNPIDRLPGLRDSWARYVVGALAYSAHRGFAPGDGEGFHVYAEGDIPAGAGLSSSSALIVASLLAMLESMNGSRPAAELVSWGGEAEHFVGTRGGCGDHAAILLGQEGNVSHFDFHPFRPGLAVAFPEDWRVLVCHSGIRAEKATDARARFNRRVMAYHLGRLWMRGLLPEDQRETIQCLRDFLPLDSRDLPKLYKLLRKLPESATPDEIRAHFDACGNGSAEAAEPYLAEIESNNPLDLRGVCLFGLAETARARAFIEHLEHGDMARVVELMYLSHDGDRIVSQDRRGGMGAMFRTDCSDVRLAQLAHQALFDWGNPDGHAQLWRQPGRYRSSTKELDFLVDTVRGCAPEAGAHLVGAGLGGAIVALCPSGSVERISNFLESEYYAPRGREPMVFVFEPGGGARFEFPARPESPSSCLTAAANDSDRPMP